MSNFNLRPHFWTLFLCAFAFIFAFSSCNDDGETLQGEFARGYLVVNEGVFLQNNASVTHIARNEAITQDIFQNTTAQTLGDNLQSISVLDDEAYLLVSNSNKIEVVNRGTFESLATITGNFANPRYMAEVGNGMAYISTWGSFTDASIEGKILVIDTDTEQVTTTIEAGSGAETLVYDEETNKVFVANNFETSISVYNVSTNSLEATIDISPNTPNDMVLDRNGDLWVMARQTEFVNFTSPTGALCRINTSSNNVEATIQLNAGSESVGKELAINPDENTLYYNFSSAIYELPISSTAQATSPLISSNAYGLSVNPRNGDIWIGIDDFEVLENNEVRWFDEDGNLQNSLATGFGPNEVIFLP